MSDNATRKQPDPTSDFDIEASPQRTDADLWEAFHAAQGAGSPTDAGSAPMTDETLPPGDEHLDPRPLQQQFKKPQESDGQRPTEASGLTRLECPLGHRRKGRPSGQTVARGRQFALLVVGLATETAD